MLIDVFKRKFLAALLPRSFTSWTSLFSVNSGYIWPL